MKKSKPKLSKEFKPTCDSSRRWYTAHQARIDHNKRLQDEEEARCKQFHREQRNVNKASAESRKSIQSLCQEANDVAKRLKEQSARRKSLPASGR